MKNCLLVMVVVLTLPLCGRSQSFNALGLSITANLKIGKTIQVTKLKPPVFRNFITQFSVTSGQSSPHSLILFGRVVDNNAGAAQESIPIFFGSTLHQPRLAALTNVNGNFRFRIRLTENPSAKVPSGLRAVANKQSTLYLGGRYNGNAQMLSSYTHIYPLRLLKPLKGK